MPASYATDFCYTTLDKAYLEKWISELALESEWNEVRAHIAEAE